VPDVVDLYEDVGGDDPFYELVDLFYAGVERTPDLRALYPADLEPGKKHLAWFLIQRFGGPSHFNELRGAPMLRRRHMSFGIDLAARDAWVTNMMLAVDAIPIFAKHRALIERYFDDAATFLINRSEPPVGGQMLEQV
jgi:hemoglobin